MLNLDADVFGLKVAYILHWVLFPDNSGSLKTTVGNLGYLLFSSNENFDEEKWITELGATSSQRSLKRSFLLLTRITMARI